MNQADLKRLPPVAELQWLSLCSELGIDALRRFSIEFFSDLEKQWHTPVMQLQALPEAQLRSLAHRYAGTAGTLGFSQIRQCLLNIQYTNNLADLELLVAALFAVVEVTKSVVFL
jgi:HPt (histidine-containing phosphotransfer) domain-containing protein